ncbi:dynamin family protein [Microcystis sp. M061S2]|uniref:dynamin family protein n=1 Tax=Microcystis sp. M061S2 TaxID=2771171 RepID=UPI002589788C|nr:dynamin family protein [Microcystis sp. M061S2]MCA2652698.1 dynamin family protein [Microcystis sp. M061S2]
MAIDRDLLQRLSAQPITEPSGVEGLVRSIHRAPVLRDWVTLESVALAPVPAKRGRQWGIMTLLSVPTRLEDNLEGLIAPWGAVEWIWPEKTVVQTIDLRFREDTALLRQSGTIPARPATLKATLTARERTQREKALFHAIDQLISNPASDEANLASLASHYAGLLPTEIYPYYWALIPESKTWLYADGLTPALTSPEPEMSMQNDTVEQATEQSVEAKTETYVPLPSPIDLTERIGTWLRQALNLAKSFSLSDVVAELQGLNARRSLPGFRLAFVGEFSRGKSHLLNQLLSQRLLPEGVTPTTATLTSIIAGSENCMEVKFSQAHKEVRPVQESSWNDLLGTNQAGTTQEVLAEVRLTLAHPWLQINDMELIDTPGVGDPNSRRAALVLDLLSQCDAAVLVISATSPLSMTESAFLEQEVIGRHIPRIIVVVSKLDLLPGEDRSRVLAFVRERVAQISTAIPVLPSYPVDSAMMEAEVLEVVRTQIQKMVVKGQRRAWRSRQVAQQLSDYLSHLMETGEIAIANARLSAAEREQERRKVQASLQEAEIHWEGIEIELERRRLQSERKLREKILNATTEMRETLAFDLSKTSDSKSWWELDLPFRLRRELIALGRQTENFLMMAIAQNFEWLQIEVERSFKTKINMNPNGVSIDKNQPIEIIPNLRELSLTNIRHYRLFTRLGGGVAIIGGYLLSGPVGIAASIGAGIVGEQILNKKLEEQRQLLAEELERSIDRTIDEYCNRIDARLRQIYHQLIEETKAEQAAWFSVRNAALKVNIQGTDESAWQQMIDEASMLRKEILADLNK